MLRMKGNIKTCIWSGLLRFYVITTIVILFTIIQVTAVGSNSRTNDKNDIEVGAFYTANVRENLHHSEHKRHRKHHLRSSSANVGYDWDSVFLNSSPKKYNRHSKRALNETQNLNQPKFELPLYQQFIDEDTPVGTSLIQVKTTGSESVDLVYNLTDNVNFTIDNDGVISSNKRLDADYNGNIYSFNVTARNKNSNKVGIAQVRVYTNNKNDEPPRFSQEIYPSRLDENAKPGAVVITVVATDKDGDKVTYGLIPPNGVPHDLFIMDRVSGVIRLGQGHFTFDKDRYELNVTAEDDGSCCLSGQDSLHTSFSLVVVSIIDVNDHKPIFQDCDTYSPTVKENAPVGTYVITVTARDEDRGENGVIDYNYVPKGSEHFFQVEKSTGIVKTLKVFDREGADGKFVPISIIGRDRGNPPLDGVCSFKVIILDVNDNSPVFDRQSYDEKMKQQTKPGSDIFRLSATDDDADNNAVIVYSLEAASDGNTEGLEYFTVDPDSGWVSLKKPLGVKSEFHFMAKATDKGEPPLEKSVPVRIQVVDKNINPPQFQNASYTISIPENVRQDSIVGTLSARSGIHNDARVRYETVPGNTVQTNKFKTFYVTPDDDGSSVRLLVSKPLDYEDVKEYNLTIRAVNYGSPPLATETTVSIKVTDVNDEIPEFAEAESLTVLEGELAGTKVGQLHATDKDSTYPFNLVTFSLVGPSQIDQMFKINNETGEISTNYVFDRELNETIQIRVKITDGAPSARANYKQGEHNSFVQDFAVYIGDRNDNPPSFDKPIYKAEVKENEDIGHLVIHVQANDKDQSSRLRYEITEGNIGSAFSIKADTGSIVVAGNIDYENLNFYKLTIVASDSLYEASTQVEISVLDLNDNAPKFTNQTYEVTIWERDVNNITGLPQEILKVSATDADKNRPNNFKFFLTGQAQEQGPYGKTVFTIDEGNGMISVNEPLDRDPPNGRPTWRFNVFAVDEGDSPDSLDGYAEVIVHLRDINDNAPSFSEESYIGHINENAMSGTEIMTMTAVDNDDPSEGTNAQLTYSILENVQENGRDLFSIDPNTAKIKTNVGDLDRERKSEYVIKVLAKDGGGQIGTGSATIRITDLNDSPPKFEKSEYVITIPETEGDLMPKEPVLLMKVIDEDLPETNQNYFEIVKGGGSGWDLFQVIRKSSDTAALFVRKQLDYENEIHRKGFNFDVRVSDTGSKFTDPTHIAQCKVTIKIFDINDNAPVFETPIRNVSVKEDSPVDTVIAHFRATDADRNGSSKVSYVIQRSTNKNRNFAVDSTGKVTIKRQLDREDILRHVVHILAVDDGAPPKTATATLTVNVLDVNDNAPEFAADYRPVVDEMEPYGQFVVEVLAYDKDDYSAGNGPPFEFSLSPSASTRITESFRLEFVQYGDNNKGSAKIYTKVTFDREEQKEYYIPIVIKDAGKPQMSATSTLTVIIGDVNDNPMGPGSTNIFVYNYRGRAPTSEIGRVYVDDKDDWDLPSKTFSWDGTPNSNFALNSDTGTITMINNTRGGVYTLFFSVYDAHFKNTVLANATVTIKEISELAVFSSGSIRMAGISEEQFISVWDDKENKPIKSKYALMKEAISDLVKAKLENIDLFTVKKKQGFSPMLDVRFSAHGSPYYHPEKLNGILSESRSKLEEIVGVNITMIGIDECLYENVNCDDSCSNELEVSEIPYVVVANKSCLAGVRSEVVAQCTCTARNFTHLENCGTIHCYNGGSCLTLINGNVKCHCLPGFHGPRCQQISIGFQQSGFAWFPPIKQCEESHLSLEFITKSKDGLLFYNGPVNDPDEGEILVKDFVSLELIDGYPRLLVDFGSGTLELKVGTVPLNDEEWHRVDVYWSPELVRLVVDMCEFGDIDDKENSYDAPVFNRAKCEAKGSTPLFNEYLNVNGPLQIGGVSHNALNYQWEFKHTTSGFIGCIKNFVVNSELYDLGSPANSLYALPGCPLTEEMCKENDVERLCVNGACIGSKSGVKCECLPGYVGDRCDQETPAVAMLFDSFINYDVKFDPNPFKSEVMLQFRTDVAHGELFRTNGKDLKEFLVLEIYRGYLLYRYNLHNGGREEGHLWLDSVAVNDGLWHNVILSRFGSVASISLDGGEGRRYNETLTFEGLHQMIEIQKNGIFAGGFWDGTRVLNDFRNSCMSDIRFDLKVRQLPLPPISVTNALADAGSQNVDGVCPLEDYCFDSPCPEDMTCVLFSGIPICQCIAVGYAVGSNGKCEDINECDRFPCKNGGICLNNDGGYLCECPEPFVGQTCDSLHEEQKLALGTGALAAILVCALCVLILALVLVVYTRNRRTNYGPVYPEDDIRENIINYNDEGGGEDDMNTYDIGALRIPVDHNGTPLGAKPGPEKATKEPRQNRAYSPGSEPDVGDFINSNLDKANEDPDALPSDDVRLYAYEGAGSTAGSLSSLASGTDDNEQDFDYLNSWGPRFQKLADMYGQGESEEE
ncbi:hypothetical protein CHUAL_003573 [Chamberlinius hualienensis]